MFMGKEKRYTDDLPAISISRLRAQGVVSAKTTEFTVRLGDVEAVVGVTHMAFPNGGGWSYFLCPCCGRKARTLRLLNGRLLRSRCFQARGVLYRAVPAGLRQRAALRIPKLRAMLESDKPLRLKPSTMRGKMERRERHEAALQRNLLILRRHDLAAFKRALVQAKD